MRSSYRFRRGRGTHGPLVRTHYSPSITLETINERVLGKEEKGNEVPLNQLITRLTANDPQKTKEFYSPEKRPNGFYVTSEATLNSWIDPRIFIETQIKRACRWLATTPPVIRVFFNWLFVKKMKMKLDYFRDKENLDPSKIYKTGDEHKLETKVVNGLKIHNLGHATQLIQTEGLNILTDPVFGDLNSVIYPSMTKPLGQDVKPADLPPIDVILISHNHRDHVDTDSLKQIQKKNQPQVLVPMGDKEIFEGLGFKHVREVEWHTEATITSPETKQNVNFCSVPADHRSGRYGADHHRSLVSGWVVTPEKNNEIVYFAGDTARLSDIRIKALAVDIYALYRKKGQSMLPNIVNMCPGGPNYTRRDMVPTHQSAVDSLVSAFRLALAMQEVSGQDQTNSNKYTAQSWLMNIASVFMHHNRFELGTDRFNENVIIFNRLCSYLDMDDAALEGQLEKQKAKSTVSTLFHRRKDFIIDGVKELKALARQIWADKPEAELNKCIKQFIQAKTHFPLINEKMAVLDAFAFDEDRGEVSTIKPDTQRGVKVVR